MWVYIVCFMVHSLFTTSLALILVSSPCGIFSFVCSSSIREGVSLRSTWALYIIPLPLSMS